MPAAHIARRDPIARSRADPAPSGRTTLKTSLAPSYMMGPGSRAAERGWVLVAEAPDPLHLANLTAVYAKVPLADCASPDLLVQHNGRSRRLRCRLPRVGSGVAGLVAFWLVGALLAAELASAAMGYVGACILILAGVALNSTISGSAAGRNR